MAAPEKFTELKQQVETAESNVRAAAVQNQAELRAKVEEARRDADERAARMNANVQQAVRSGRSAVEPGSEQLGPARAAHPSERRRSKGRARR
jgi:hypothetical protein